MTQKTEKDLWVEMSIQEISSQANYASIAYSHIDPKAMNGNDAVFSSIHSFLSHCAIISKMLKAVDNENPVNTIGGVLEISTESLIHKRKFRNGLEHYDKELKGWIHQYGVNTNIMIHNIGPKEMIKLPNALFVSHYDPGTGLFTFINKDFDLPAMHEESLRIKSIADEWIDGIINRTITPPYFGQ